MRHSHSDITPNSGSYAGFFTTDHSGRESDLVDNGPFSRNTMNPLLQDMNLINGQFITQHHHILLLTLEEAQQITDELLGGIDYFFSFRAAPGNIKVFGTCQNSQPTTAPPRNCSLISKPSILKRLSIRWAVKPISKLRDTQDFGAYLRVHDMVPPIPRCWKWRLGD